MEFNLIVFTAEKMEAYIAVINKRDHFAYSPDLNSVSIFGNYSLIMDSLVAVTAWVFISFLHVCFSEIRAVFHILIQ